MPPTLLIVANDPNIVYLLTRYAEKTGFQPIHARQAQDIGALAQETRPAVIILEDDFPVTLYRASLDRLQSIPETRAIPVVVYACLDPAADLPVPGVASFLRQSVKYDEFLIALEQAGVMG